MRLFPAVFCEFSSKERNAENVEIQMKNSTCVLSLGVVEMMGIEPMSENTSLAVSPSAADDLGFAPADVRQQTSALAIP